MLAQEIGQCAGIDVTKPQQAIGILVAQMLDHLACDRAQLCLGGSKWQKDAFFHVRTVISYFQTYRLGYSIAETAGVVKRILKRRERKRIYGE